MFISVLSSINWTTQYSTVGEQVFLGITMSLVGITLVFLILVLISTVVSIMSMIISRKTSQAVAQITSAEPAHPVKPTQAAAPAVLQTGPDPALVAAITAAVSAVLAAESHPSSTAGFRIRQIRRV